MTDLNELLERVKKATGPDRELDWHIADVTNHPSFERRFEHMWPPFGPKSKLDRDIPPYTASIDAALALVERVLPMAMKRVCDDENGDPQAEIVFNGVGYAKAHGATWPLAILAALLSALIAKESSNDQ